MEKITEFKRTEIKQLQAGWGFFVKNLEVGTMCYIKDNNNDDVPELRFEIELGVIYIIIHTDYHSGEKNKVAIFKCPKHGVYHFPYFVCEKGLKFITGCSHEITINEEDNTVSISPSIGEIKDPKFGNCDAHYYIRNNKIEYV